MRRTRPGASSGREPETSLAGQTAGVRLVTNAAGERLLARPQAFVHCCLTNEGACRGPTPPLSNWQFHVRCGCDLHLSSAAPPEGGVVCSSGLGWTIVIALGVMAAGYGGGGLAWNVRTHGQAVSVEALPHRAFWQEVWALCHDGVAWTVAKARGEPAYQPVGAAEGASKAPQPPPEPWDGAAEEGGDGEEEGRQPPE